jgi:hypothetical protein
MRKRITPTPAASWPAWTDDDRWELGPDDAPTPWPTAEEIAEYEAETRDIPPRRQVSPIELSQIAAHGCV